MLLRLLVILSAAAYCAAAHAQDNGRSPLQPADLFAMEAAADVQISPDGQRIAYVRRTNDIMTDRARSSVWVIDYDGRNHMPVASSASADFTSPRWAPDSGRLAYVASTGAIQELRLHWVSSSRDAAISRLPGAPMGLQWSPDGNRLAFAAFAAGSGPSPAPLPARPEGAQWAEPARVEERLVFRADGRGLVPHGVQQLFVVGADGGTPLQVTDDAEGVAGDFAWTRDGSALIVSADRRPERNAAPADTELHRIDLASGSITQLTDRRGPDISPAVSPDGRRVAYLGHDQRYLGFQTQRLYVMDIDGSNAQVISADFDRSLSSPVWAQDGRGIYVSFLDQGESKIALISLNGNVQVLADGLGGPSFGVPYAGGSYSVSPRTGRFAGAVSSPLRPAEVAAGDRRSGLQRITSLNDELLSRRHVSDAEEIWWPSPHDGRQIQGWVLHPPGFDPGESYPLFLEIHGGPFAAYGPTFTAELPLMAAAGYVVLYTNPRGSTGYGEEFANLIDRNYPSNDYDDLMGGVDALIARGYVDEERLFVSGGSGGGVLTAWIVGNTDRFAAASAVKPVINWGSFVLHADLTNVFYRFWFDAPPWEDPDSYWRRSPLSLVGNVTTPTMVMVGGDDLRTPVSESEQYYTALRIREVPTRLVVIPGAPHGITASRPSRLLMVVAENLRWFAEHDPANRAEGE